MSVLALVMALFFGLSVYGFDRMFEIVVIDTLLRYGATGNGNWAYIMMDSPSYVISIIHRLLSILLISPPDAV